MNVHALVRETPQKVIDRLRLCPHEAGPSRDIVSQCREVRKVGGWSHGHAGSCKDNESVISNRVEDLFVDPDGAKLEHLFYKSEWHARASRAHLARLRSKPLGILASSGRLGRDNATMMMATA